MPKTQAAPKGTWKSGGVLLVVGRAGAHTGRLWAGQGSRTACAGGSPAQPGATAAQRAKRLCGEILGAWRWCSTPSLINDNNGKNFISVQSLIEVPKINYQSYLLRKSFGWYPII